MACSDLRWSFGLDYFAELHTICRFEVIYRILYTHKPTTTTHHNTNTTNRVVERVCGICERFEI
jgi:hypothetical protein